MRRLNRTYRGVDRTTDVLSFPMHALGGKPPFSPPKGARDFLLGDIVLDAERVSRQAQEAGHSAQREYRALLIHGILHLLGYDHETGPGTERTMRLREQALLKMLEGSHNS